MIRTLPAEFPIADSVRGISKWVESLIDSQINLICALICALLETAPQGCSGAVMRALIGMSGVVLAA